MKKRFINFTYSKDGEKTVRAVRSLRAIDTISDIVILDDLNDKLDDAIILELQSLGCYIRPTEPQRWGNLRSFVFAKYMVSEYLSASRTCDAVIKFDSDVIFKDNSWIDTFYESGMPLGGMRTRSCVGVNGCVYALRSDCLPTIYEQYEKGLPSPYLTEEDYELSHRTCLAFNASPSACLFLLSYEDVGVPYSKMVQLHETPKEIETKE